MDRTTVGVSAQFAKRSLPEAMTETADHAPAEKRARQRRWVFAGTAAGTDEGVDAGADAEALVAGTSLALDGAIASIHERISPSPSATMRGAKESPDAGEVISVGTDGTNGGGDASAQELRSEETRRARVEMARRFRTHIVRSM